jgi:hypothetical protein
MLESHFEVNHNAFVIKALIWATNRSVFRSIHCLARMSQATTMITAMRSLLVRARPILSARSQLVPGAAAS